MKTKKKKKKPEAVTPPPTPPPASVNQTPAKNKNGRPVCRYCTNIAFYSTPKGHPVCGTHRNKLEKLWASKGLKKRCRLIEISKAKKTDDDSK